MLLAILYIYQNTASTDFLLLSLTDINLDYQKILWLLFPSARKKMTIYYNLDLINNFLRSAPAAPAAPVVKYQHYAHRRWAHQLPCMYGEDLGVCINLSEKSDNKAIVPYGMYLGSSIQYKPHAKTIKNMVNLPPILLSVFVGVVISDGNLTRNKYNNTKFYFKQTLKHFEYF